ncbi:alpha-amylase family glycosyl hydrolase [Pontibacter sp. CAU 1760]
MQWDDSKHAGFTNGSPWLPVNDNYKEVNVAVEEKNPNSILNHFREMVSVRDKNPVLVYGAYRLLLPDHKQVYAYTRTLGDEKMLVLLNFSEQEPSITLPDDLKLKDVVINNYDAVKATGKRVTLKPYQAVIFNLN